MRESEAGGPAFLGPRFEALALLERLGYRGEWTGPLTSGPYAGHERWLGRADGTAGVGAEIISSPEAVLAVTFTFGFGARTAVEFERLARAIVDYFAPDSAGSIVERMASVETASFDIERQLDDRAVAAKGYFVGEDYLVVVRVYAR